MVTGHHRARADAGSTAARTSGPLGPPADEVSQSNAERPFVRDVLPDVLGGAPTAIAVYRPDRSVAYRNTAWVRLIGEGLAVHGPSDPITRALVRGLATENEEHEARRADGTVVRLALTAAPLVDEHGDIIGATAYAQPVDGAAIGALREALLGVLSHELRTPITSIYGGSQLLLHDQLSAESRAEILATIAAEAEQLHRRVEDFLAVARVERGLSRPEREPLLVQRLIAQSVATERRRSPDQRFDVRSPHDLPPAVGDAAQVGQILRNLIANAVDAKPLAAPVLIEAALAQGDCVRVKVKDRGPGVPLDATDDMFSLYHRHPAIGGHVPRSGLGLYVARTLVEANGGRIWLRGRQGGGTEVGFSLPLYDVAGES